MRGVVLDHVAVSVPGVVAVAAAGIDLDEADAPFHQPPGDEALAAEFLRLRVLQSVQAPRGLGFPGQVHGFGSRLLHPERQLVAGDSGHQLAVFRTGRAPHSVQAREQPQLVALLGRGDSFLGLQKEDRVPLGTELGALVAGGHEAGAPVGRTRNGAPSMIHHHYIAWQIPVLATQAVGDPGTQAGMPLAQESGVHLQQSRTVGKAVGIGAAEHGHFVDAFGLMREEF